MYKEQSVNNKLFVKPEFWHEVKVGLITGLFPLCFFLSFIYVIPLLNMWHSVGGQKIIWTILMYRLLGNLIGIAGGAFIILFVMKYLIKKAYFKITEEAIINKFIFKNEIPINKLKRIEQIISEETGECILLKFYSSQALYLGAVKLDNLMFDLDKIVYTLKKNDSISPNLWVKSTNKKKKNNNSTILLFCVVFTLSLFYWSIIWVDYQFLNARPHGLLYVFPISFMLQAGVHKIGFGIITLNFTLSLVVNFLLCISAYYMSKISISIKTLILKITLWIGVSIAVFLLLFYNYLCLTYNVIE